jgi:hypothetical protein
MSVIIRQEAGFSRPNAFALSADSVPNAREWDKSLGVRLLQGWRHRIGRVAV